MPYRTARAERCFKSPGPHPNGLQAAPDGLWCIDQGDDRVYRLDYDTGAVLFEAQTDTVSSSGITVGDGCLWVASTYESRIARLDPETGKTLEKYDSPGAGVTAFNEGAENPPATGAHGLEWRDGKLYVASPPSQMVHVMGVATWEEERRLRTPGLRVHGVAWSDSGMLWMADTSAGTVSLVRVTDGRIYDVIRVPGPDEVHGMTIREGVLWYCDGATCDIGRLILDE